MASVAASPPPPTVLTDEGGGGQHQLQAGKRQRPAAATMPMVVARRRNLDQYKWALLEREKELERRRVEEVSRIIESEGTAMRPLHQGGVASRRTCCMLLAAAHRQRSHIFCLIEKPRSARSTTLCHDDCIQPQEMSLARHAYT